MLSIRANGRMYRHKRVRSKIRGTSTKPRFVVFRSQRHIYGQIIDDIKGKTLVSVSSLTQDKNKQEKDKKTIALYLGGLIGEKALKEGIKKVVFDKGGYKFHGRIKAFAEAARKKGLEF